MSARPIPASSDVMPADIKTTPYADRVWTIIGAVSVRTKILGIVLALVVLLGVGVTLQVRAVLSNTLQAELQRESVSITRDFAARATDLILINDLFGLQKLMREMQTNNPNVRYAFVIDENGQVLAHLFGNGFPDQLLEANTARAEQHHHSVLLETTEGSIVDTAVPILDGRAGVARVGISQKQVQSTNDALTGQILITTLMVSSIGILVAGLLTWLLTRPILQLAQMARRIGEGDFSLRVRRWANDELGELADAFNSMASDLQDAERLRRDADQLRASYVKNVITAQEDERKRIARELHDGTSQSLTSLVIGLHALGTYDDEEVRRNASALRAVASNTLDEVHKLALQLRPSVLDDLGLAAALERYVADISNQYELQVDLALLGLEGERLPAEVETALYRIVQESLTNIVRHAQARSASILIERRPASVRAIVEDDGRGFDASSAGKAERRLGLYGMRERAELLNGTLLIESVPGEGAVVLVEIPLHQHAQSAPRA
jgi:signal transduction histidine kinase